MVMGQQMKARTMKMAIRDNREYRSVPMFETRKAAEGEEASYIVEGYASTFEPYVLWEEDGIQYMEEIDPHAFDEADMSDVIFCKDHQGTVFARTKNGTIDLSIDEHGLLTKTDLSKTTASRQMYEEIDAKMYTQMSFAFVVSEDAYDRDTHTRKILKIKKLYDVSAVSFPANPGTDISVATRARFDGFIEEEKAERLAEEERRNQAIAKFNFEKEKSNGIKRNDIK